MAQSPATALSLFREEKGNLDFLPHGAPICLDHFVSFAERYHDAYKQFAASLAEPKRVQPRRRAKSVTRPAEKKRRVSMAEGIPAWAEAKAELTDTIAAMVKRNSELGTCVSGNEIWTCRECRRECGSDGAFILAGWDIPLDGESMEGVEGLEDFRVGSYEPVVAAEEEKIRWEGLTFVVESCILPMLAIIRE